MSSAAAFMVPGLALWLPSGYSWGAVLMLLCTLASAPAWWRGPQARSTWWLFAVVALTGGFWLLDAGAPWAWGQFDKPSKYLLALPCVLFAATFAPRLQWLWRGLFVGACGSGAVALYQTQLAGMPRASGFTNAIQYGNLSLLLGLMCAALLLVQWARWRVWQRLAWTAAVLLGCTGSLLSQSRGGWLALLVVLPVCAVLLARRGQSRMLTVAVPLMAVVVAAVLVFKGHEVEQRLDAARTEIQVFQYSGKGDSSVGQRLAHWQLAWDMGLDRPWLGWGRAGYEHEKARRVAAGQADAAVLGFSHAHNEALDMFVKHGVLGLLVLCLFYGVPLWLFWPRYARVFDGAGALDRESLSLCLVGILLPLSYLGFGLTQVFLAHNSGNMFYLFMCMLVHAALLARDPERRAQQPL